MTSELRHDPEQPVTTLRIAIVTQGYQSAGGVQTVARWLVGGLRANGHTVHIFSLATSRQDPHSRLLTKPSTWRRSSLLVPAGNEPDVTHVGANGAELEILRYLPRRDLDRALDDFDVVQVVTGGPALAWATSRTKTPVALQVATTVRWERAAMLARQAPLGWLARQVMTAAVTLLEVRSMRGVRAIHVENREMGTYVAQRAPQTPAILAPPGVDTTRFTPHPEGWRRDGYLLSVCRLGDPRKGLDRLIDSYAQLRARGREVTDLVLAGRNNPALALMNQIRDLGLAAHIHVRSDVPTVALPSLFQGASVYLQTSYEEGLGISVLEAMGTGLPVVATETAGTLETVIRGETGWLVPQGAEVPHHIAEMTLRVLDGEGPSMARNARERAVSTFDSEFTLGRFLSSYARLLDGRARELLP